MKGERTLSVELGCHSTQGFFDLGDKKGVAGHIPQGFINYSVQYTIHIKYCTNHGLISIIES